MERKSFQIDCIPIYSVKKLLTCNGNSVPSHTNASPPFEHFQRFLLLFHIDRIPVLLLFDIYYYVLAGWLFLDASNTMFVNARARVYRCPQAKLKTSVNVAKSTAKETDPTGV